MNEWYSTIGRKHGWNLQRVDERIFTLFPWFVIGMTTVMNEKRIDSRNRDNGSRCCGSVRLCRSYIPIVFGPYRYIQVHSWGGRNFLVVAIHDVMGIISILPGSNVQRKTNVIRASTPTWNINLQGVSIVDLLDWTVFIHTSKPQNTKCDDFFFLLFIYKITMRLSHESHLHISFTLCFLRLFCISSMKKECMGEEVDP